MKKRLLAVADIHGCYTEFKSLLRVVNYDPHYDQLILLGDYVDRGPDSYRVVSLVIKLAEQGAIVLKGNHDQMFVDFLQNNLDTLTYSYNGGRATLSSYANISLEVIKDHIDFLRSLPLYWENEDFLFVHAGIDPNKPLKDQTENDFLWIRDEWLYSTESLAHKTVVFGHSVIRHWFNSRDIFVGPGKMGINTGAGCGGYLSLIDLYAKKSYSLLHPSGLSYENDRFFSGVQ